MAVINKEKYETFPNRKNLEDLAKEKKMLCISDVKIKIQIIQHS